MTTTALFDYVNRFRYIGTAFRLPDFYNRFQDCTARSFSTVGLISTFIEDDCILEDAKGYIRSVPDVGYPEDNWTSAIIAIGIMQTLYQQILDPRLTDLRLM